MRSDPCIPEGCARLKEVAAWDKEHFGGAAKARRKVSR